MIKLFVFLQIAKLVAGPCGRHAVLTVFKSVVNRVPAAKLVFVYRKDSAIPSNRVRICLLI